MFYNIEACIIALHTRRDFTGIREGNLILGQEMLVA